VGASAEARRDRGPPLAEWKRPGDRNAECATATVTDSDRLAVTAELLAAAGRGELHAVVHELLPLQQAGLAHQKMAAVGVFGRIALESLIHHKTPGQRP
jgi:hypothetical protein